MTGSVRGSPIFRWLCATLVVAFCLAACATSTAQTTGLADDAFRWPVDLTKAQVVADRNVTLGQRRVYLVAYLFRFKPQDAADEARVRQLLGRTPIKPDVVPRARVSIWRLGASAPLADEEVRPRLVALGASSLRHQLGSYLLPAGDYRIVVTNLAPAPELEGVPTELALDFDWTVTPPPEK